MLRIEIWSIISLFVMGGLIYHIKALSVLIQSALKIFQNVAPESRKTGMIFLYFWSYFEQVKQASGPIIENYAPNF